MTARALGLRTWLLQRLSALYMAVYTVIALFWLYLSGPIDFVAWQELLAHPLINIFTQLFIYSLLAHAWIGVKDIFIDYVPNTRLRFVLFITISLLQIILAFWTFMAFYGVVRL
ncbi:MAG: succinate dehydrogenase, hydrophobic membrane anchor protein [Gammaproteobacteria bacterium]|nr:succinate dehydrogenase, hydrophobic membrane anchor protein [Gammaproteobacteria bacterium]